MSFQQSWNKTSGEARNELSAELLGKLSVELK